VGLGIDISRVEGILIGYIGIVFDGGVG